MPRVCGAKSLFGRRLGKRVDKVRSWVTSIESLGLFPPAFLASAGYRVPVVLFVDKSGRRITHLHTTRLQSLQVWSVECKMVDSCAASIKVQTFNV